MIRARFEQRGGTLCGVTVTGHAGFADAGSDIVCAAVSSAVQYATILITEQFGEQDEECAEDDRITVRLCRPEKGQASRVLEGLRQHLQFLSEDFPGTIQITNTEV